MPRAPSAARTLGSSVRRAVARTLTSTALAGALLASPLTVRLAALPGAPLPTHLRLERSRALALSEEQRVEFVTNGQLRLSVPKGICSFALSGR